MYSLWKGEVKLMLGNYHLELFGWAWLSDVKTFWIGSWNYPTFDEELDWTLFMTGWYEGSFYLKLFNIKLFGEGDY